MSTEEAPKVAEPKSEEIPEQQFITVSLQNAEECPVVYANYATVTATPVDIQIVFAHFGEVDEGNSRVKARARVRVTMTPEHAVLLLNVLKANLQMFVIKQGPIRGVASTSRLEQVDSTPKATGFEPKLKGG